MRFHNLAAMFYRWGWHIKHDHYVAFSDYVKEMLKRKRVFAIYDNAEIIAIVFYYLSNDYRLIYKKGTWDVVNDDPNGHQIYIDKMVCKKFDRNVLRAIKQSIEDEFPNITEGVWHRSPFDKCVRVRRSHALQS